MDDFLRFVPMVPLFFYGGYCFLCNENQNLKWMAFVATVACMAGCGQGGFHYLFDERQGDPGTHSGIILIALGLLFLSLSRFLSAMASRTNATDENPSESDPSA